MWVDNLTYSYLYTKRDVYYFSKFGDIDPNRSEYVKSLKDLVSNYKSRTAG